MIWRIDVFPKRDKFRDITPALKELGINKQAAFKLRKVYLVDTSTAFSTSAELVKSDLEKIASALLIDPVIEDYSLTEGIFAFKPSDNQILITHNPGVCDNVALSLEKAIADLSLKVEMAKTGRLYEFQGLDREEIFYFAKKSLYNQLIEHPLEYEKSKNLTNLDEFAGKEYKFDLIEVDLLKADDKALEDISKKGCLSLSLDEMRVIQAYFKKISRNPTDCELETLATLWSEHCGHKTFRGIIDYQEKDDEGEVIKEETINNLLKSTVMKATKEINSPDCISVFSDNSGVVRFDEKNNICFKVETHNHPSALEPYGGASTGIGGVIRDILGTGCAARPFASLDVFCFSNWNLKHQDLPKGLLHPKRIIKGVVRGVRDYGNRMGIPTIAGAVCFDERFLGNPLVYCGTLGIMPKEKSFKKSKPGDLVILCGARTGRDGIHGATFSSKELDEDTVGLTSAVQIGNPIEEKKLTEAILRARDKNLFTSITDCGAGGISSAITELAAEGGVEVDLDKVSLKYRGLSYTEIWISESQERMVFFTDQANLTELESIFTEEDVDLKVVGRVTGDNKLTLLYQGQKVCGLDMDFIFNQPDLKKQAFWIKKLSKDIKLKEKAEYNQDLKKVLSAPNVACKDWILREYDHEVQAGSVLKAIAGIEIQAVNDAAVIRPDLNSSKAVVLGLGINPFYSDIDPYWMAALSIDEALRNVVSAGGNLDKTFILDNFSWGSPLNPEILGGLVRASKACYDFSTYFGVPFISGKDSLYNEYDIGGKHISIPGTLLISAASIIDNWQTSLSSDFKKEGSLIYLIGMSRPHLGASEYLRALNIKEGLIPQVDKTKAKKTLQTISSAIARGLVLSCHDLSEGGLAVAAAEMAMGSGKGASIFLNEAPQAEGMLDYELLFSESPSRFMVEVGKEKKAEFEKELNSLDYGLIGCVTKNSKLVIINSKEKEVINSEIEGLKKAWTETFSEFRYQE